MAVSVMRIVSEVQGNMVPEIWWRDLDKIKKDSGEGGEVCVRARVNELEKARLYPSSILCYDWQRQLLSLPLHSTTLVHSLTHN